MKAEPLPSSSTTPAAPAAPAVRGVLVRRALLDLLLALDLGVGLGAARAARPGGGRLLLRRGGRLRLRLGRGPGVRAGTRTGLAGDDRVDQLRLAQAAKAVDAELVGDQVEVGERALVERVAVEHGSHAGLLRFVGWQPGRVVRSGRQRHAG